MGRALPTSFRFRISASGYLFLLLTLAFGLQSVLAGNNLVFIVFAAMAGFASSLALLTAITPGRVSACLTLPETAYAGEPFQSILEIRHARRFPSVYWLQVHEAGAMSAGNGFFHEIARLKPGQSVALKYAAVASARGWFGLDEIRLRCQFPFGLFAAERGVPVSDRLLVYPRRWMFHRGLRVPGLDGLASGMELPGRYTADWTDFAGLREFHPGDHPRHINWHASSRMRDQILVRHFEPRRDRAVMVMLDSFYPRGEEARCRPALEDNICLVLAVVEKFLADRFEVVFAGWSSGIRLFHLSPAAPVPPELRRWLATLEPDHTRTLADLLAGARSMSSAPVLVLGLPRGATSGESLPGRFLRLLPEHLKPFASPKLSSTAAPGETLAVV